MGRESEWDRKYDGRKPEPPYECPTCAHYAAKVKDREGLAKVIIDSAYWGNGANGIADAVIRWLEEGKVGE
jgi:hypothetical protein